MDCFVAVIVQSQKVSLVIARSVSDEAIWFSPPKDEIRLWWKERDCFATLAMTELLLVAFGFWQ
jgi:hypothetical protein